MQGASLPNTSDPWILLGLESLFGTGDTQAQVTEPQHYAKIKTQNHSSQPFLESQNLAKETRHHFLNSREIHSSGVGA